MESLKCFWQKNTEKKILCQQILKSALFIIIVYCFDLCRCYIFVQVLYFFMCLSDIPIKEERAMNEEQLEWCCKRCQMSALVPRPSDTSSSPKTQQIWPLKKSREGVNQNIYIHLCHPRVRHFDLFDLLDLLVERSKTHDKELE